MPRLGPLLFLVLLFLVLSLTPVAADAPVPPPSLDQERIAQATPTELLPYREWMAQAPLAEVQGLLDRGADVTARDAEGHTPLHWAVFNVTPAVAALLLDRGADPTLRDNANQLPVDLAGEHEPRPGKTEAALERGRASVASLGEADRQIRARTWSAIGALLSDQGEGVDYAAAIAGATGGIAQNPADAAAYATRGSAKYALGQYHAALVDFDRALALNPTYAHAYHDRGTTQARLGRRPEARADYQHALVFAQEAGDEHLIAEVRRTLGRLDNTDAP